MPTYCNSIMLDPPEAFATRGEDSLRMRRNNGSVLTAVGLSPENRRAIVAALRAAGAVCVAWDAPEVQP